MAWDDGLDPEAPAYGIAAAVARFVRVVAGPGTGKSFALKRRVARLLEEGNAADTILPVTFTNVAAEDLQREMLQVGVPGCEDIRGFTLHSLCMRILGKQHVLQALGRVPRPLNRFEIEPLLYDIPNTFGDKRQRNKRIRAYEAAWARLQHDQPGYALSGDDRTFEGLLIGWLTFHQGMLIGEIIPYVYIYLRDNPAAPERNLYAHKAYAKVRSYCENGGLSPWELMVELEAGRVRIPHTASLTARFREIQAELNALAGHEDMTEFILAWLHNEIHEDDGFHRLALDASLTVDEPAELLSQIIEAVANPEIPPDVAEVRIMSLHKSKGLSSAVVIIAGCVEGLLPVGPDEQASDAENAAMLEEQRRLFFVGLTRVKANPVVGQPGILMLTSSRSMSLADAMGSGIVAARIQYGRAFVHTSRFMRELGPDAPAPEAG